MTHRTMCKCSYHGATSRSCLQLTTRLKHFIYVRFFGISHKIKDYLVADTQCIDFLSAIFVF